MKNKPQEVDKPYGELGKKCWGNPRDDTRDQTLKQQKEGRVA